MRLDRVEGNTLKLAAISGEVVMTCFALVNMWVWSMLPAVAAIQCLCCLLVFIGTMLA